MAQNSYESQLTNRNSIQVLCHFINKFDTYKKRCKEIQESLIDFAESQLLKKMKKEDLGAIIFFLKTKGKKRGYTYTPKRDTPPFIKTRKKRKRKNTDLNFFYPFELM